MDERSNCFSSQWLLGSGFSHLLSNRMLNASLTYSVTDPTEVCAIAFSFTFTVTCGTPPLDAESYLNTIFGCL